MFKELDLLDYTSLIDVSHGILSEWDHDSSITRRLPDSLSSAVASFLIRYPQEDYEKLLVQYIKERTANELPLDVKESGQTFFDEIL